MKSDTIYKGELKDPNKDIKYLFNLFINKIYLIYIKYIYNFKNKHNLY